MVFLQVWPENIVFYIGMAHLLRRLDTIVISAI